MGHDVRVSTAKQRCYAVGGLLAAGVLLLSAAGQASAHLRYEGTLVSPTGSPFEDGRYWVVFAVYDDDSDPNTAVAVEGVLVDLSGGHCSADIEVDSLTEAGADNCRVVPLQVLPAAAAACGCGDASQQCGNCTNADMVDHRHAARPGDPKPGYLYPLHADKKFPNTVLRTGSGQKLDADMVDRLHASRRRTAGYLYPLGPDAKFPNRALQTGHGQGLDADLVDGLHASELASGDHNHDDDYVNEAGDTMSGPLQSIVEPGEAPIMAASPTLCPNVNADLLDDLHASQIVAIAGVPSGTIVMWAGETIPDGWHRFTALDGLFPRGADTYGGTGGSTAHTHHYSGVTALEQTESSDTRGYPTHINEAHRHPYQGDTDPASSLPPYLDIVFIQKD